MNAVRSTIHVDGVPTFEINDVSCYATLDIESEHKERVTIFFYDQSALYYLKRALDVYLEKSSDPCLMVKEPCKYAAANH